MGLGVKGRGQTGFRLSSQAQGVLRMSPPGRSLCRWGQGGKKKRPSHFPHFNNSHLRTCHTIRNCCTTGRPPADNAHTFSHIHILTCTTGVHMHTFRNCSIWGDSGAPPLTMTLTRPPSLCLILLNTIRSETTDACGKDEKVRKRVGEQGSDSASK